MNIRVLIIAFSVSFILLTVPHFRILTKKWREDATETAGSRDMLEENKKNTTKNHKEKEEEEGEGEERGREPGEARQRKSLLEHEAGDLRCSGLSLWL